NRRLVGGAVLGHSDRIALLAVVDDYACGSSALRVAYFGAEAAGSSCDEGDLTRETSAYRGATVGRTGRYISRCHCRNKVGELAYGCAKGSYGGYVYWVSDEVWIR